MTSIDDPFLASDLLAPRDDDAAPPSDSLLERLRAQRAHAKPKHLDLVIPNNGAETGGIEIIARMKAVPYRGKLALLLKRLMSAQNADAEMDAACDILILGLDQLCARDGERVIPLDEDDAMRFDQRTAEALGLDATRARDVVYELWGGKNGEFALQAAAGEYGRWLRALEVVSEDEGNA
jgi:hypothetical protein